MAKNVQTPDDVQIASMNYRQSTVGDLLAPGPGTPWEDRSSIGAIPAFFKTVVQSMTSPGTLLHSLRRPETSGDARTFVLICGLFWGLGWVLTDYLVFRQSREEFDFTTDGEKMILHFFLGFLGTWGILVLVTRLFYKLVSAGEMKAKAPPVLFYNVYAYCLGPSILALIPYYIGFGVALAWILCLFIYAAIHRLAVKTNGAIICNIIAVVGIVGSLTALYLLLHVVFRWLYT